MHSVIDVAPKTLVVEPAGHCVHAVDEFKPVVEEYVPFSHGLQPACAGRDCHVPIAHNSHLSLKLPAEKEPARHAWHISWLVAFIAPL